MSEQAVQGFIGKINQDAKLGAIVTQAFAQKSDLDLVKLGNEHGFAFTREEGMKVWDEMLAGDELSDVALEVVAGGSPVNCAGGSNPNT